jgi:hypothetical protein
MVVVVVGRRMAVSLFVSTTDSKSCGGRPLNFVICRAIQRLAHPQPWHRIGCKTNSTWRCTWASNTAYQVTPSRPGWAIRWHLAGTRSFAWCG